MSIDLAPARAAASRRNGAKSRGPKTAGGKARSARNALKHGLCARSFALLDDEYRLQFAALAEGLERDRAHDEGVGETLRGRRGQRAHRRPA